MQPVFRFCHEKRHSSWKHAIRHRYCDKGLIMTFLHWICEMYLQPRRKRSKKKTVNQYWRDFKMLYRRANHGRVINANDCEEVVKVCVYFYSRNGVVVYVADVWKYINGRLKSKFKLDDLPGSKPVMGVDDLLLGLTHHWSRDRSVFPTEDDRLDLPSIMLFQAYTACRPAELVDGTKTRGGKDPLLDDDLPAVDSFGPWPTAAAAETCSEPYVEIHGPPMAGCKGRAAQIVTDSDSASDLADPVFDYEDAYESDETDDTEITTDLSIVSDERDKAVELPRALQSTASDGNEEQDQIRRHKALCYEDLVLWIVKDPKGGQRDVLAMEAFFRYHKGADNKPKP